MPHVMSPGSDNTGRPDAAYLTPKPLITFRTPVILMTLLASPSGSSHTSSLPGSSATNGPFLSAGPLQKHQPRQALSSGLLPARDALLSDGEVSGPVLHKLGKFVEKSGGVSALLDWAFDKCLPGLW